MSDEERIAKLQKLLDRVLTRSEPEEEPESSGALHGEHTQISEGPPADALPADAQEEPALERTVDPSVHKEPEPKEAELQAPAALESRSRLVSASTEAEELNEDDLVPASESTDQLEAAVPLVRRSKRAAAETPKEDAEPLSDGRFPVGTGEIQLVSEEEQSLAEEIASEEIHSSEIEEDAPISSRRPIDSESATRVVDESPPESGKQITAAPYESPPSGRKSTSPPSASRDHDVIRAELPPSGKVASITPPLHPRPVTFGALVDLTLDLV